MAIQVGSKKKNSITQPKLYTHLYQFNSCW